MSQPQQSTVIKDAINLCLEEGLTDKQEIYSRVVKELGVPRPTVRRVARDLRNEMAENIKELETQLRKYEEKIKGLS